MRSQLLRRSLALALVLAVTCGASAMVVADEGLNVIEYLVDPVRTRDADGRLVGSVPQTELPSAPAVVIDVQRDAVLVATPSGRGVWLDRNDVKLDRSGSVRQLCTSVARTSGAGSVDTVKLGMRASCAKQLAP